MDKFNYLSGKWPLALLRGRCCGLLSETMSTSAPATSILAYRRFGAGPPLVLLHGLGSDAHAWEAVLEELTAHRTVYAVDLPGVGGSSSTRVAAPSNPQAFADVVEVWIKAIGLDRPHVAGNSLGGGIALELARRGAASSATLISPIGFWTAIEDLYCRWVLRGIRALAVALRAITPVLLRFTVLRTAFFWPVVGRPWRLTPEQALAASSALVKTTAFQETLQGCSVYRAHMGRVPDVPLTTAWGTRDALLPRCQARRARRAFPHSRFVWLQGCGHVPMTDDPPAVAAVLLAGSQPLKERLP